MQSCPSTAQTFSRPIPETAVGWGSRHVWLVRLATKPSKGWRWRQERAGTRQLRLRDEDSVTPKWEHNKNHIICHGKYALPDASLYFILYFEFSTACFKYRILFNHQDKQRHYFLHFQLRKIWFQEFTFSFSSSKQWEVGWGETERENTGVFGQRVVFFTPTYVASYSFWKVPCLVLAQVGMDARIRNSSNVYGTSQRWWE